MIGGARLPIDPGRAPTLFRAVSRVWFPPGPRRCAVSGGADSLALLAIAATDPDVEVTAVHVDHGLRPDSADDAAIVRAAADQVGAGFESHRVSVGDGPNLEARARDARHHALGPGTLFAHTADDQAEWVLLALVRGSGLDGVASMDRTSHPLLSLRRADTEAICAELGWDPVRDPTNVDPRFCRNRVRHEVLPLLAEVAERDVVPLLARFADLALDDVGLLDALADDIDPTDAIAVANAPTPLARRAVRNWLRSADPAGRPPDAAALHRVLAVAAGDAVAAQIAGGWSVRRHQQRLGLVPPPEANDEAPLGDG